MEYPQELLPKIGYRRIASENGELFGFYLLRCTNNPDIFDNSTEQLKDEFLEEAGQEYRFFTWSCNLFNCFDITHIPFKVHNKELTNCEWDFLSEVEKPLIEKDFVIDNNFGHYFILIDEIFTETQIPHNKAKVVNPYAKPFIYHCPNKCNYWHFELRWKDQDDVVINRNRSEWKNNLISTMKSFLRECCVSIEQVDQSVIPILSTELYGVQ